MGEASAGAGKMGRSMFNNNAGIPDCTNLGRYNITFADCNQRGAGSGVGVDSGTLRFIDGNVPTDPAKAPKSPPAEKARQCVLIRRRTEVDRSSDKIREHTVGIQHSKRLTSNYLLKDSII